MTVGRNSVTNDESFWPAVTFRVRLPPGIAVPELSRRVNVNVPVVSAINAIPVFVVPVCPTETGKDTVRAVTVVAALEFGANTECINRASTVTLPFEKTFANPPAKFPLFSVLIVIEPEAGIKNVVFGSTSAGDISDPSLLKKSTIP